MFGEGFEESKSSKLSGTKEGILREVLPFVRAAYEKAQKKITEGALKLETFVHPYGADAVREDTRWVEAMEQKFSKTMDVDKIHADIIEAILYEHIEQSNWFGDDVRTIKTSRYDDLKNGVDLIVEFQEGLDQFLHMGLAVDVTFGETKLRAKIQAIKDGISHGKLAEIKYFKSERSPHKGLYEKLSRVVIGVDRSHVMELARIWIDDSRKKEFAVHPVQKLILHQVAQQLISFARFAEECGQDEMAHIYQRQLVIIRRSLAQKKDIDARLYEEEDGVTEGIQRQLNLF